MENEKVGTEDNLMILDVGELLPDKIDSWYATMSFVKESDVLVCTMIMTIHEFKGE